MVKHYYQNIPGWCDFEKLYSEVVIHAPPNAKFVEVGSFLGKSACFMAIELIGRNKTDVEFYCVDNWNGVPDVYDPTEQYKGDVLYKQFTEKWNKGKLSGKQKEINNMLRTLSAPLKQSALLENFG